MQTATPTYYIAWMCMIHLSLLASILFFKKTNRAANIVLGGFMLVLAGIHLSHILLLSGWIFKLYWLNPLCIFSLFLAGPLYLRYTSLMTGAPINWKKQVWLHSLPFIMPLWYVVGFFFRSAEEIAVYYTQARQAQPMDVLVLLLLVTLQMAIYTVWSILLLKRYDRYIRRKAYHEVMSLRWLYVLSVILFLLSTVLVPVILWFVPSNLSVLYTYMPVVTMGIYLAIFYKSINFPGAEHEKRLIRELEREKISRDMHDELGAGITRIALLAETAKQVSSSGKNRFGEISGNARQLSETLRDIIWDLNTPDDSFEAMLAYLREYIADYLEEAGITFAIRFPEKAPPSSVARLLRRNICAMIKEILNNVVRHAQASEVLVSLQLHNGCFSLTITDNGIGFDSQTVENGNGLNNLAIRTQQIKAELAVASAKGRGTRIYIGNIPYE